MSIPYLYFPGLTGPAGSSPPPPPPPTVPAGTGSVAERLAYDVAGVVNGLDFAGAVKVRRRPAALPGDFPAAGMPLAVVVVQRGRTQAISAVKVDQTYTVGVAVALPTPAGVGPTADVNGWVEDVRQAVHGAASFPTTPEFNVVKPTSQVPFDPATLDRNYAWSWCGFEISCVESRG